MANEDTETQSAHLHHIPHLVPLVITLLVIVRVSKITLTPGQSRSERRSKVATAWDVSA